MLLKLKVSTFHSPREHRLSILPILNNISEHTLLIRAAQETDTELNDSFDQKFKKKKKSWKIR